MIRNVHCTRVITIIIDSRNITMKRVNIQDRQPSSYAFLSYFGQYCAWVGTELRRIDYYVTNHVHI